MDIKTVATAMAHALKWCDAGQREYFERACKTLGIQCKIDSKSPIDTENPSASVLAPQWEILWMIHPALPYALWGASYPESKRHSSPFLQELPRNRDRESERATALLDAAAEIENHADWPHASAFAERYLALIEAPVSDSGPDPSWEPSWTEVRKCEEFLSRVVLRGESDPVERVLDAHVRFSLHILEAYDRDEHEPQRMDPMTWKSRWFSRHIVPVATTARWRVRGPFGGIRRVLELESHRTAFQRLGLGGEYERIVALFQDRPGGGGGSSAPEDPFPSLGGKGLAVLMQDASQQSGSDVPAWTFLGPVLEEWKPEAAKARDHFQASADFIQQWRAQEGAEQ